MNLDEFRSAARDFLEGTIEALQAERPDVDPSDQSFRRAFEDRVCRGGWSGLGWPEAYGGRALPPQFIAAYLEEYARAGAPQGVNTIGHDILAPTLLLYGTEDQKRRFIPRILTNEEIWCQGYSEPGAGSDLAALRTRAVRDGDDYIVNGQKIWTSWAHIAHWCFLLVRTDADAPKHKGITFLLVDMRSPGVTVRPIRQMSGEQEFNEVFFDNVRVPAANRVGEENDGWRLAMAAAGYERAIYFVPRLVRMEEELKDLVAIAATRRRKGRPISEDPGIRRRLAQSFIDVTALKMHAQRMLEAATRHEAPGPEGSYIKLVWSESHQRLMELALEILGPEAALGPQETSARRRRLWQRDHLFARAETILAGTSEIHRNVIGERVLGLPR